MDARANARNRVLEERLDARARSLEGRMQEKMSDYKDELVGLFERWTHDCNAQMKGKGIVETEAAQPLETPRISPRYVNQTSNPVKQSTSTNHGEGDLWSSRGLRMPSAREQWR